PAPVVVATPAPVLPPVPVVVPVVVADAVAPVIEADEPPSDAAAAPGAPHSGDPILPGMRRGSRQAAREEKVGRQRRRVIGGVAGLVVVVLAGWFAFAGTGGSSHKHAAVAPVGRTQSTLLIQLTGSLGAAVDSALVAHDTAQHNGVVVLVPSQVIAQVPGFGAMPFGQALTVGDPAASRETLADLVGVTVDGSWALSPQAMSALVTAVGGVTVTVDKDVTRQAADGSTVIVVSAGLHKLDGSTAVAFATFLDSGETEQARLARFDAVLRQVVAGLPTTVVGVSQLVSNLGPGSVSSFAGVRLAEMLVGMASDIAANATLDQVLPVTPLDNGEDQRAFTLDTTKTADLVRQQLAASVPESRKATGNRVLVENQVGTPGIGESTRAKLQTAGFLYAPGPNAATMPDATSPSAILIFGTTAAEIERGHAVAAALGLPVSDVKVSEQRITVADVVVIIGADYRR
ncbi:MAG: hypothetical protein QOJ62_1841, partial [Actinomycetota bacterium]|nr:hypothetical protein [Actinomycetota bacterium]